MELLEIIKNQASAGWFETSGQYISRWSLVGVGRGRKKKTVEKVKNWQELLKNGDSSKKENENIF